MSFGDDALNNLAKIKLLGTGAPAGSLTPGSAVSSGVAVMPAAQAPTIGGGGQSSTLSEPSALAAGSRDTPLESDAGYQAFMNAAQLSDDQARADAALRSTSTQQALTGRLADISRSAGIQHGQIGNSARYRGFGSSSSREALDARTDEDAGRTAESARTDVSNQINDIQSALSRALADTQMQRGAQGAQAAGRLQQTRDAELQRQQDDRNQQALRDQEHADQQALLQATQAASAQDVQRAQAAAYPPDPGAYLQSQALNQDQTSGYLHSTDLANQLAAMKAGPNPNFLQATALQNQIQQEQVNAYLRSLAIDALKKQATPPGPPVLS